MKIVWRHRRHLKVYGIEFDSIGSIKLSSVAVIRRADELRAARPVK